MEDIEDTQDFYKYALPDVSPLMLEKYLIMKVMNLLRKEGTSQIIIYLIQCMLTFHNIESKRLMIIISKTSLGGGGGHF